MWYKAAGDADHSDSTPVCLTVTIGQTSLDAQGVTIYAIPDQNSTGEQLKPKPVVKHLGYLLKENEDYTLSYANNVNRWESGENPPTVTVTGMGGYSGTLTKTFKIILPAYNGVLTVTEPSTLTYGTALGAAPTYAEHTFNGWATVSGGNPVYRGGQKVTGLTSVSGATVDLYAVWTENTYQITGEVKEERDGTTEQSIVAGVTVKIMRGSVEFAATTTDDYGKYTFSGVPAGSYNIVATRTVDGKTQTMTALVEVKSDKTVETIVLPPSGVNSALNVTGDSTPPVMVGGLDDVAKDEAEENKEVTVTMTVEQKDESTATERQKQEMEEIKEAVAADSTTTITADDPAAGKVFDKWTTSDGVSFANANSSTTTFTMPAKNVTVTATYKTASSPAPYYPGGGGYTLTYAIQTEKTEHSTVKTSYEKTTSGTRVTITATPDVGYEVGSVTVTDASGNSVKVTKNTNGTYSFTMPASKVTVTFVPAAASGDICDPFRDIDRSAWYHDGVHYALEKGIMSGMGDGQFAPSGTTTRAQILWNIEGKPTYSGAIAFTDVNANEWYAPAIRWANAEGIIGGYGDGRFGPNDAVTREQLVTILYRYAKYKGVNVSAQASLAVYDDAFTVSDWAMEAMQWAVGSGLISGKTASTLDPQDKASRAEIATIIMRYCEQIAK